jgi:integrase
MTDSSIIILRDKDETQPSRVSFYPRVHPVDLYLADLAPSSRRTMFDALSNIASYTNHAARSKPWHELTPDEITITRAKLRDSYQPSTVNRHLAALRGVLLKCFVQRLMDADAYERARISAKNVKAERLPAGRMISKDEIKAFLSACDDSSALGARDAALFAVLCGCGMRRSEAQQLQFEDLDLNDSSFTVIGKGDKQREVFIPLQALTFLRAWLSHRGDAPGPLFTTLDKWGNVRARGLSTSGIVEALKTRGFTASIDDFSPHDLRRTFISVALEQIGDHIYVADQVGHASIDTTRIYDRRGAEKRREAIKALTLD